MRKAIVSLNNPTKIFFKQNPRLSKNDHIKSLKKDQLDRYHTCTRDDVESNDWCCVCRGMAIHFLPSLLFEFWITLQRQLMMFEEFHCTDMHH